MQPFVPVKQPSLPHDSEPFQLQPELGVHSRAHMLRCQLCAIKIGLLVGAHGHDSERRGGSSFLVLVHGFQKIY